MFTCLKIEMLDSIVLHVEYSLEISCYSTEFCNWSALFFSYHVEIVHPQCLGLLEMSHESGLLHHFPDALARLVLLHVFHLQNRGLF